MAFTIETSRARHLSEDKPSTNLSFPNSEQWVLASLLADSLNFSLQAHFLNLLVVGCFHNLLYNLKEVFMAHRQNGVRYSAKSLKPQVDTLHSSNKVCYPN